VQLDPIVSFAQTLRPIFEDDDTTRKIAADKYNR